MESFNDELVLAVQRLLLQCTNCKSIDETHIAWCELHKEVGAVLDKLKEGN